MPEQVVSIKASTEEAALSLGKEASQINDYQTIKEEDSNTEVNPTSNKYHERCIRRCYRQKATAIEHIVFFCALSVASYVGVVARIYLGKLSAWNGVPLFPSFSAEITGTAIMGFIISHKKLLEVKHKAVYQAIATGLCGSITTFSSWNLEAVDVLLQINQEPPNNANRIFAWITTILIGLGMPIAALQLGKHISRLSPWNDQKLTVMNNIGDGKWLVIVERTIFVMLWILLTVIGIVVPFMINQFDLLFSIVLSAFGTYIRWHLSPLNKALPHFPLGTLIVNVMGSWILGAVTVLKWYLKASEQDLVFKLLIGLGTGFCGCLTTVSTFAVELTNLPLRSTYLYALCSLIPAQVGLIVITGVYHWVNYA